MDLAKDIAYTFDLNMGLWRVFLTKGEIVSFQPLPWSGTLGVIGQNICMFKIWF